VIQAEGDRINMRERRRHGSGEQNTTAPSRAVRARERVRVRSSRGGRDNNDIVSRGFAIVRRITGKSNMAIQSLFTVRAYGF